MWLAAQHELLLQIIERPDDDQLRLVLADRLSEVADPLGELIIVQCALERMAAGKSRGDWTALKARELQLVRQHGASWHQQSAPFARSLRMRRGLPHKLVCSAAALLADKGLTVLAPIQELELEQADAEQLESLIALPLLRRVRHLSMPSLRGLGRLSRRPGRMPANIVKLDLGIDDERALDAAVTLGLIDTVEDLEVGTRWLAPESPELLLPPAAPALKRLAFNGRGPRLDRAFDEAWLPALRRLVEERPGLQIGWRGIDYDAENLDRIVFHFNVEQTLDPVAQLADTFNREPFGPEPADTIPAGRALPSMVEFVLTQDNSLVASGSRSPMSPDALHPLSLDAAIHLRLAEHPSVLTARAFEVAAQHLRLRFEPWRSTLLADIALPLPVGVALRIVDGIARGLEPLRDGLRQHGVMNWPSSLSRDDVLVGLDGSVKLVPPFVQCLLQDSRSDADPHGFHTLGLRLEVDHRGTDDGALALLGTALMHMLAGEPVTSRRLRPSAVNPEWRPLDALVDGCLSTKRSALLGSVRAFTDELNKCPLIASSEAVAEHLWPKQSRGP